MSAAVILPVEIDGQPLRLVFKFGTMRLAEQELGIPVTAALRNEDGIGFDVVSALFWAVLQPNHMMTRDASDNLVDSAGIATVSGWIGEGVARYFNAGEDPAPGEAKAAKKAK